MIDLREYFYNKIKNEMDHWDMSDAYSITFFLYSNEAYTYKEYSNVCEFSISLNNETFFKSEYSGDDEGLIYSNSGLYCVEKEMETLFAWYKQEGIENIGYEDPDCYDENCRYIGKGPVGYYELLEVISDVARRLIEEDYFLQRCGKRIPIIIQDLEFTWYVLEATKKVNIHDEAHDFFKALESGNM